VTFRKGQKVRAAQDLIEDPVSVYGVKKGEIGYIYEVIRKYEGNSYDIAFLQRPGLWICSDDELEEFK
jgi:hypothetical protein